MDVQTQLRDARDRFKAAYANTKRLGERVREEQTAGHPIDQIEVDYKEARAAATTANREVERLSEQIELDRQSAAMEEPAEYFSGREGHDGDVGSIRHLPRRERATGGGLSGPGAGSRRERGERRRLRQEAERLELFSRAGVKHQQGFERFKLAHVDAFEVFLRHGYKDIHAVFEEAGFKPQESMALLTTTGDLGGFLAPDIWMNEVMRDLAGFAAIRPIARVEPVGGPALVFPSIKSAATDADVYGSGYTGAWKGEGYVTGGTAPTVQNQPTFEQNRIPVHAWAPDAVELTNELITDSRADVEGILAELIAETLAMDEDAAFISGNGVGRPMGLLSTATGFTITAVNSGAAAALTYDGLIDLFSNLPAQYRRNARWLMNSLTYGAVLKLKDGNGMPLFTPGQIVDLLWGKPIVFQELMPDIAANNMAIIFGDFRYYVIADRQELRVQRLVERYAPNIGILPTARIGGQTVRTAAFRKQKISA